MARVPLPDMRPWGRAGLVIPPDSTRAWIRLAAWELWMGLLICVILGFGVLLISSAPERLYAVFDFSRCYGPPPVALPCERIAYQGGALEAVFTAMCGVLLLGVATWFLWELWSASEPKPITDDFLRLLHASFGRNWRDPRTWPWGRVLWAYGFTAVGAVLTAGFAIVIWMIVASPNSAAAPDVRVETSQSVRVAH